tara:strand:- start:560 stop:1099 length:540 start_codon:yes stop_codon:yes gene_type:complete
MNYLVLKTIHLISVVAWFAGLFYVGRLFIYFKEASIYESKKKEILQEQFLLMTKRCMYIITWPSLIISTFFGLYMLHKNPGLIYLNWMIVKLVFVIILIFYTAYCQKILFQMKKGSIKFSDFKLRLWNEFATLLLISIISLAILKTALSWFKAVTVFIIIGILLFLLIKIYRIYINSKN